MADFALGGQNELTAYLKGKQLLPFDFVASCGGLCPDAYFTIAGHMYI